MAAMCVLDSDNEGSASDRNISELISRLRTAYRTKDFDRVEEILVSREVKLKRELNKQKCEVELWKRRFEELGIRVSKLEEDTAMLMDMGPQVSNKCGDNASVKEEKCCGKGRVENGTNTVDVSIQNNGFGCDENTSVAAGAGLNLRSPTKTDGDLQCAARPTSASRAIVDILDSDDDHAPEGILRREENKDLIDKVISRMLKRKQTTCVNVSENINGGDHEGDDDICPTSKRKMKQQQELIRDTYGSRANHCSDSTAFSGSQNVNKLISSSRQDVIENMNGGIHKVEGNIFPTSTRDMKEEEESIRDTGDCPVNCCSATAVSSGCKNVDKLASSSRQCEEKMKTVHASRNLMHELVLEGDSDSSSSSSDSDDEFISSRIAKLERQWRV
ncbi:hypothetical protein F2P56_004713 [Juglans regia]|uniref:Uncharacterized protein LOC109021155 n=2 Tax=Juglans regia TaxID=51240 RepID=A0A6P9E5Q7_JUGRE|nr:uncharacterized protein LOC109021155 [Juglans regia]XP_035543393.1 uncharacterized protein LOC109021155 [Juglans regia]XP_035543394.1 uncharacterized protein LOC109021155 [Juglans regia]XP_035543395.1 uncharacterized protein LOC109021155 [Juglans regia]KAF5478128.1 hypothetical protein F2P56_004713 [Juglans regia]